MATILIVCTGNICRSPMAEAMISELLAERNIRDIRVASAGTWAQDGAAASPGSAVALAERGIDLSGHAARRLTRQMVASADLIVTMTREQRAEVEDLVPGAASKTFTLREFDTLLSEGPAGAGDGSPADRLRTAVEVARARREARPPWMEDEDVMDPLGMPADAYRMVATDIEELAERIVRTVFAGPRRDGRASMPAEQSATLGGEEVVDR